MATFANKVVELGQNPVPVRTLRTLQAGSGEIPAGVETVADPPGIWYVRVPNSEGYIWGLLTLTSGIEVLK